MSQKLFMLVTIVIALAACDKPKGGKGAAPTNPVTEKLVTEDIVQVIYAKGSPSVAEPYSSRLTVNMRSPGVCGTMIFRSLKISNKCEYTIWLPDLVVPKDACDTIFKILNKTTITTDSGLNPDGTYENLEAYRVLGGGGLDLKVNYVSAESKNLPLFPPYTKRPPVSVNTEQELYKVFNELHDSATAQSKSVTPEVYCP